MRILITNDDGINAPGLDVLGAIARDLAGDEGEVWTVAPASEQSGVGHCISYTRPMLITELAPRRFAIEGTPSDCILAGFYDVLGGNKPDLVLSGVNRGNNSAENALYSGTVGAAMEAALHGVRAIALSQYYSPSNGGPSNGESSDPFEAARTHAAPLIRTLFERGKWQDQPYGLFYNVNFPPVSASDVKGIKVAAQGFRTHTDFTVEPFLSPSRRRFLWVRGGAQHEPTEPGTDARANLEGYISVTPMRADLTAHETLGDIAEIFR